MKNIFRKLACYSFLSITSIGCFEVEARVTKEVAEAVLPYLMEAVGIDSDKGSATTKKANKAEYENDKIQAILNMIYTDEGQRQMVKWAKEGIFPYTLKQAQFPTDDLYLDGRLIKFFTSVSMVNSESLTSQKIQQMIRKSPAISQLLYIFRDSTIGALFPCVTGTFSSFAANPSRLGYQILNNASDLTLVCASLLQSTKKTNSFLSDIRKVLLPFISTQSLDRQLAGLLFVIDICDNQKALYDILDNCNGAKSCDRVLLVEKISKLDYDEYDHVPVSATALPGEKNGDCVENMCRHLIAWAIHNRSKAELGNKLDIELYPYVKKGMSGIMNLCIHKEWKTKLSDRIINNFFPGLKNSSAKKTEKVLKNIYIGSVENIARILYSVLADGNTLLEKNGDKKKLNAEGIGEVLSFLSDDNIEVVVSESEDGAPSAATQILTITNQSKHRQIKLAICANGHAEIFKVNSNSR